MYTFLRNAMVGWHLRPEVAVVTLVYVERFEAVSGITMTPDNWQRLAVTCMMLASKVPRAKRGEHGAWENLTQPSTRPVDIRANA